MGFFIYPSMQEKLPVAMHPEKLPVAGLMLAGFLYSVNLFVKADEQIHIDEMKKHEVYCAVLEEAEKPRRQPEEDAKNVEAVLEDAYLYHTQIGEEKNDTAL